MKGTGFSCAFLAISRCPDLWGRVVTDEAVPGDSGNHILNLWGKFVHV
ncbi:MAG TPA: hypothetical protein GX393_01775 [Firmicutes bacterium]|nr:hypothetical protein [Bacillota bacterium]